MSTSNPNNKTKGQKRSYHHSSSGPNKPKWQPKRGGPGIMLTCDTGRDFKAKREGLEVLNYYYNKNKKSSGDESKTTTADTATKTSDTKELTLEEELAQLKSENQTKDTTTGQTQKTQKEHGPFAPYDTGCRGTVFLLCTLPNCNLVPIGNISNAVKKKAEAEEEDTEKNTTDANEEEPTAKKAKTEETEGKAKTDEKEGTETTSPTATATTTTINSSSPPPWDPTDTVRQVMNDLNKEAVDPNWHNPENIPGSRFVTRMVPMQATCFASLEEITITFRALLEHRVLPKLKESAEVKTFAIKFKKRNCGNVTRDQVIDGIVEQIMELEPCKNWKVNLGDPVFRIQVEICKTLCGILYSE